MNEKERVIEKIAKRLRQIEIDAVNDYNEEIYGEPKGSIKWGYLTDNEKGYWYMRANQNFSLVEIKCDDQSLPIRFLHPDDKPNTSYRLAQQDILKGNKDTKWVRVWRR